MKISENGFVKRSRFLSVKKPKNKRIRQAGENPLK